tara:strand:- start:6190 stop:6330 length:141 start_codon:yes stop_codon:yes gene_type:complete
MKAEATKKLLHRSRSPVTLAGHYLDTLRINRNQRKLTGDKNAIKGN